MQTALAPRCRSPRGLCDRAVCAASCVILLCAASGRAQLANSYSAQNPFGGQGEMPSNYTAADYPVDTQLVAMSLLSIDERFSLASFYIYLRLKFWSPEAVHALRSNYTSCAFYCSSRPSRVVNKAGQPACCDNVFIPQALAINSRRYFKQTFKERWSITPLSDARIRYFRTLQGSFQYSWARGSFPFDSHYVLIDVQTAFKPILVRNGTMIEGGGFNIVDGYALDGENQLRAAADPAHYRQDITSKSLPAWDVTEVRMELLRLDRKYTKLTAAGKNKFVTRNGLVDNLSTGQGFQPLSADEWRDEQSASHAVRLYIKIRRRSTGFWVMTCILPVALVTIFGFGVQSLPRQSLKARAELLSTIFLSLVLLQTVLYQFLPPLYFLALPLMLTLVGYLYTLLLFLVIIAAHAMEGQWHRRRLKAQRRWGSQVFRWWAERLEQGPCAQEALAQSAARSAAPVDVAREQVLNPLQGSRLKLKEGQKAEPAVPDATQDLDWLMRQEKRWWFRIRPIRFVVEWWKFTGLEGSEAYCHLVAHRFDQGARLVLLVTYLGVVIALCLSAYTRSESEANAPLGRAM